jgi:hypothetical protein
LVSVSGTASSRATQAGGNHRLPSAPQPSAEHWLGDTQLLLLQDPGLRFRAESLVQMRTTDAQRLLAVQAYVKSLEFVIPWRASMTARHVLDGVGSGWFGKATLFVSLLRIAGFPARMRLLQFRAELFRGFVHSTKPFCLPVVEVWTRDRWVRTDTYAYDPEYLALAHRALLRRGWVQGFGVHRWGNASWTGCDDAMVMADSMRIGGESIVADCGAFDDPQQFLPALVSRDADRFAAHSKYFWRKALLRRGIRRLRAGAFEKG